MVSRARRTEAAAARRPDRNPPRRPAEGDPRQGSAPPLGELRSGRHTALQLAPNDGPARGPHYLVAHELAHLRVRGHTPEYWAVVAQATPDSRLRRERLRSSESESAQAHRMAAGVRLPFSADAGDTTHDRGYGGHSTAQRKGHPQILEAEGLKRVHRHSHSSLGYSIRLRRYQLTPLLGNAPCRHRAYLNH